MHNELINSKLLFVYGTLLKGHQEDWKSEVGATLVGRGRIKAELYDLGDYPGAVDADDLSKQSVFGEVYKLNHANYAFNLLDQYEECKPNDPGNSLFLRKVVPVTMQDGRREYAWAYFYNRGVKGATPIPSGNYRERVIAKR